MKIMCKGFILRPPKLSDLDSYYRNINDPFIGKNMRYITYPMSKPSVSSDLKKKIKMNSAKPKYMDIFVICVGNECAGMITLGEIIRDHKAWIGYWLGSDYRGKGIMTLAIKKITDYGFKRYKLRRIEASVATFNKASTIILEKCGYKLEGTMKKNRLKNGKYYDEYLYAITRP